MKKDKSWLGDMPVRRSNVRLKPTVATPSERLRAAAAELQSAREAGYRKGFDDRERSLNTVHDNEINCLNIEMARRVVAAKEEMLATMDREFVKGFLATLAVNNKINPTAEVSLVSIRMANAIARELTRAYDKEKQA